MWQQFTFLIWALLSSFRNIRWTSAVFLITLFDRHTPPTSIFDASKPRIFIQQNVVIKSIMEEGKEGKKALSLKHRTYLWSEVPRRQEFCRKSKSRLNELNFIHRMLYKHMYWVLNFMLYFFPLPVLVTCAVHRDCNPGIPNPGIPGSRTVYQSRNPGIMKDQIPGFRD